MTVVVAAIVEQAGRFLLTRRLEGTHLAGLWEFPGGKVDGTETHTHALKREMLEELGTDVLVGERVFETTFAYNDRLVQLHFYRCALMDTPRPMLGQEMAWVHPHELRDLPVPEADRELIARLAGPPTA